MLSSLREKAEILRAQISLKIFEIVYKLGVFDEMLKVIRETNRQIKGASAKNNSVTQQEGGRESGVEDFNKDLAFEYIERPAREPRFAQITFASTGCPHSCRGTCSMCSGFSYVDAEKLPSIEACVTDLKEYFSDPKRSKLKTVLLDTGGSVLGDEFNKEKLFAILDVIAQQDFVENILIETHLETINEEILKVLKKHTGSKKIKFEIGFESSNEAVRNVSFLKGGFFDKKVFIEKAKMAKKYGAGFTCNIVYGAPYLTQAQRQTDALNGIRWCLNHGADDVVFFPLNIRKNTLVNSLYENGAYERPSIWEFIEVLGKLSSDELCNVNIAWFGNKDIFDGQEKNASVMPKDLSPEIISTLQQFTTCDGCGKKKIIDEMLGSSEYISYCSNKEKGRSRSPITAAFGASKIL